MIKINTTLHTIVFLNKNDQWDRENDPAYIHDNHKQWWKNGKLHRIGGPAVIDGKYQAWYIEGVKYTESEYHNKLKEMGLE